MPTHLLSFKICSQKQLNSFNKSKKKILYLDSSKEIPQQTDGQSICPLNGKS